MRIWPKLPDRNRYSNEDAVEAKVEALIDAADRVYLTGGCTAEEYSSRIHAINEWAK